LTLLIHEAEGLTVSPALFFLLYSTKYWYKKVEINYLIFERKLIMSEVGSREFYEGFLGVFSKVDLKDPFSKSAKIGIMKMLGQEATEFKLTDAELLSALHMMIMVLNNIASVGVNEISNLVLKVNADGDSLREEDIPLVREIRGLTTTLWFQRLVVGLAKEVIRDCYSDLPDPIIELTNQLLLNIERLEHEIDKDLKNEPIIFNFFMGDWARETIKTTKDPWILPTIIHELAEVKKMEDLL